MSSGGSFTITSANDGTLVPADGFKPGGNFRLDVLGGTTITAEVHVRMPNGTFIKWPDADGRTDIGGNYIQSFQAAPDDVFKISVTSATGTWQVTAKPVRI